MAQLASAARRSTLPATSGYAVLGARRRAVGVRPARGRRRHRQAQDELFGVENSAEGVRRAGRAGARRARDCSPRKQRGRRPRCKRLGRRRSPRAAREFGDPWAASWRRSLATRERQLAPRFIHDRGWPARPRRRLPGRRCSATPSSLVRGACRAGQAGRGPHCREYPRRQAARDPGSSSAVRRGAGAIRSWSSTTAGLLAHRAAPSARRRRRLRPPDAWRRLARAARRRPGRRHEARRRRRAPHAVGRRGGRGRRVHRPHGRARPRHRSRGARRAQAARGRGRGGGGRRTARRSRAPASPATARRATPTPPSRRASPSAR